MSDALRRWPQLRAGLDAARPAFAYTLGTRLQRPPPCDAAHALLTELGGLVPRTPPAPLR